MLIVKKIMLCFCSYIFSIFVSFDFFLFVEVVYKTKSKNVKNRAIAKFHSAEHMVINVYTKLQRIPTFDEVKKSSRFSKICGSRKNLFKISYYTLLSLVIVFATGCNGFVYFGLVIIISIFMAIAEYNGWLIFLQAFITMPPSDSEIKLAIEGVKAFEEMEEKLKNRKECIEIFTSLCYFYSKQGDDSL